ncbi:hypothetical protein, variant [Aphanomyces astaci]|uniref:Uncharacterized protein n=1 Tax=Aphanomyces astaci TaxID=112090 RepID=W4FIT2_APHAT|nr:hypothetical protein, variant [Aphanomyces astaci]ETV66741.1 hypothetical protein, variant [Aphanomyces astaci]|eukprot:XP_009843717.1 hypothetical protein, variant [Aphanomyces astaci]
MDSTGQGGDSPSCKSQPAASLSATPSRPSQNLETEPLLAPCDTVYITLDSKEYPSPQAPINDDPCDQVPTLRSKVLQFVDSNAFSRWIVSQWNETFAFESLCVRTTFRNGGVPSYSWQGLPLIYAAILVGIAVAVVADGLTYKIDDDDDDDDDDNNKRKWQRRPSSTDISDAIHQYTWYHVLVAVLVFNACYALAAYRENLQGWRRHLQMTKAMCVVSAQVLFFLKMFGAFHGSWLWVAAPVVPWTALLALRLQWQTLVGLTAIQAAYKLSSENTAETDQWSWALVFVPIWVLLVLIASLVRLDVCVVIFILSFSPKCG